MARNMTPKAAPPPKATGNAIVRWDEELARDAKAAAEAEASTGGGQFFSTRGGQLAWQDMPLPGNQMAVIMLDAIFENIYYEGDYDPSNIAPPRCFALGRDEATLAPHESVVAAGQAMADTCKTCDCNAWGSAAKGRGKLVRNTRRIGCIPAGTLTAAGQFTPFDQDELAAAVVGYLKPPVTSVKGYAGYVKQVAGTLQRPPYAIYTKVRLEPHASNQYSMLFEALGKVPDEFRAVVEARRQEVVSLIEFPYSLEAREQAAPARGARPQPVRKPPAPVAGNRRKM